jgi:hypothetical protein
MATRMKNYSLKHLPSALEILARNEGITLRETNLNPDVLAYLKGEKNWKTVFGQRPSPPRKPKTEKKPKFTRPVVGSPSPRSKQLAEWVKKQTVINMNTYLAIEQRIKNSQAALERAQEQRSRNNVEEARRQVRDLRKNFREQQRNLREAVMRRDSTFARSYYGSGLRATPFYTRYMQRIYQRADGHYVLLGRNGRPGRAMPYPDFAYRNTGRGIVPQYTPARRRQKKTLFGL